MTYLPQKIFPKATKLIIVSSLIISSLIQIMGTATVSADDGTGYPFSSAPSTGREGQGYALGAVVGVTGVAFIVASSRSKKNQN